MTGTPAASPGAGRLAGGAPLRDAVAVATLAPSSHNSQPWRFEIDGDCVRLTADSSRLLPSVDPDGRELVISCGAALFQCRLALRAQGIDSDLEVMGGSDGGRELACLHARPGPPPTSQELRLHAAIDSRRTVRRPFERAPLAPRIRATLVEVARAEGAWLDWVPPGEGRRVVDWLVSIGNKLQFADRGFRRELSSWMRPPRASSRDGLPGYALGLGPVTARIAPFVIRRLNLGRSVSRRDAKLLAGAPAIAALGTAEDTPEAWLSAGQALMRGLLEAAAAGVSASFFNQPIEVAPLRPRLARALGRPAEFPQLLMRFGYVRPTQPTPRRPLSEVLSA